MNKDFFLILLFYILFSSCKGDEIDYCDKYDEGKCVKCKEKCFLFENKCYKCNDEYYGNIGCIGECDGTDYEIKRKIICEENGCAPNYYNLQGICYRCDVSNENCIRCSYENQQNFKCLECKNKNYVLTKEGLCELCKIDNCVECHLDINTNEHICDKCDNDYYFDPDNGKCHRCGRQLMYINGVYGLSCYFCPNIHGIRVNRSSPTQNHDCHCKCGNTTKEPIKEPYKSLKEFMCPIGCSKCDYNHNDNLVECSKCDSRYYFENKYTCIYCGLDCKTCEFDSNNNKYCTSCFSGYELIDGVCNLKCSDNCKTCDENNNNECTSCIDNYVLDENKNCIPCSKMQNIGGIGCKYCKYLQNEDKNICEECEKDYIYIKNKQICVNREETDLSEYCIFANYDEDNDLYSCIECRNSENFILVKKNNNLYDCYIRKDELEYCEEAIEKENGELSCKKCINNLELIWSEKYNKNICKCKEGQFFYIRGDERMCYDCNHKDKGKPGCYNCEYFPANDELDCEECDVGYFLFKKQCISCIEGTHNCEQCHFDIIFNKFKCDKCKDNYNLDDDKKKCKKVCDENESCEEEPKINVNWKDLYRLVLNTDKENNFGEFEDVNNAYEIEYNLVGITKNQIKTRHELLIILTFRINYSYNLRNLEEEKLEVPTECLPLSTKNETNEFEIIEYECKGKITNENNLTLNNIELEDIQQNKSDNEEFIINSSLEELINDKNIDELTNETRTFDLKNLDEIITFKSDNIGNITFENNVFNFSLNGNIDKEIEPKIIKGSLKLNEIKDKTADCELEIKENKNAQLNCNINLENTENHEFISFKSLELKSKENNSIILENFENLKLVNKIKNNENEIENENNNEINYVEENKIDNDNNEINNDNEINDNNNNEINNNEEENDDMNDNEEFDNTNE